MEHKSDDVNRLGNDGEANSIVDVVERLWNIVGMVERLWSIAGVVERSWNFEGVVEKP